MAAFAIIFASAVQVFAGNKPNIVLVMADDQGWFETGYNRHPYLKTPVLDQMAAGGLRFDRFYAAGSNCSPTRGSIMTGRNSNRFGCLDPSYTLRLEEVMLPQVLKSYGYRTGQFGKWHLGPVKSSSPVTPAACGFDEYIAHDNFFELNPMLSRNGAALVQHSGESSEIIVAKALDFIRRVHAEEKPFFTLVWFGSPHSPYEGLPADVALYANVPTVEMRHRFAEITAMDRAIGQLRTGLAELGVAADTMVWYCSDNGIPAGIEPMGPLRGSKGTIYDNGLRVPAIIEWPAVVRSPAVTAIPCVTSDMMPTILDFLEIPHPKPARKMDGISLKTLIENPVNAPPRSKPIGFWRRSTASFKRGAFWFPNKADLKGDMPTAAAPSGIQFENRVYPTASTNSFGGPAAWLEYPLKYVIDSGNDRLFNVETDPQEAVNLASSRPATVQRLKSALRDWQRDVEVSLTAAEYGMVDGEPANSLVLHYPLDEASGQIARDAAAAGGVAKDASTTGASPQWEADGGIIGGSLRFSPASQQDATRAFTYDSAVPLLADYPFTISLWLRSEARAWNQVGAFLGDADQNSSYFQLSASKDAPYPARAVARNTTARTASSPANLPVLDNQWHHVAGVFTAEERTLYLDGVAVGVDANTVNFVSNNKRFSLGALMRATPTDPMAGSLDDVGLWNYALSPEHIALIHGLGRHSSVNLADPAIDALLSVHLEGTGFAGAGGTVWVATGGLAGPVGSTGISNGRPYLVLDSTGKGLLGMTRPELGLARPAGDTISLSWHAGFADWTLENSETVQSGDWSAYTGPVEDDGETRRVIWPINDIYRQFFRLKYP